MADSVFTSDNPESNEGEDQSRVLDNNNSNNNEGTDSSPESNSETFFSKYVGDNKKYKNTEELAKAYANADAFIENLKEENKSLREDISSRQNTEVMFETVKNMLKENTVNNNTNDATENNSFTEERNSAANVNNQDVAVDTDKLKQLVDKVVEDRDRQKNAERNILLADSKVKEIYGEKAREFVENKAKELGIGIEFLRDTAAASPNAFFNLLGLDQNGATQQAKNESNPAKSSVNTTVYNGAGPKEGTNAWFEEIRKNDPNKYWSPAIQNLIFQKRKELGNAFWDS